MHVPQKNKQLELFFSKQSKGLLLVVGVFVPFFFALQVFANFTFGEPVRGGKCTVVLWAPLMSWEVSRSSNEATKAWVCTRWFIFPLYSLYKPSCWDALFYVFQVS